MGDGRSEELPPQIPTYKVIVVGDSGVGKTCLTFLVIFQLSIIFSWKFVNEFLFLKKVLYSALSWTGRTEKICEISTGTSFNLEAQPLHHKRQ